MLPYKKHHTSWKYLASVAVLFQVDFNILTLFNIFLVSGTQGKDTGHQCTEF